MAELLIIIGISTIIVTTLGLMNEAGHRGHSALFFMIPLASLGQVQEGWEHYRWWALARVAGVLSGAVGVALFVMAHGAGSSSSAALSGQSGQVQRGDNMATTTTFVTSEEAALAVVKGQGQPLSGRIHGREFHYDRVALIDGVLTASQGEGFLPDLEVRVLIGWKPQDIVERTNLHVTPSDANPPVVHVSWKPEGKDYPETRIFKGGYRMELALAPLDAGSLSGSLVLVVPDSFKSYLTGDFTAYTNHLRYRGGDVDLHFDHEDTLAYVARQYLVTQFPEGALKSVTPRQVVMRRAESSGQVSAQVLLTNGAEEERSVRLEKSDVGWSVEPGSMATRVIKEPVEGSMTLINPGQSQAVEEARDLQPISTTFPELVAYVDRSVVLEMTSGRKIDGILRKVSVNRLWLEINVGSGVVERSFPENELQSLTLSSGQKVIVQSAEKSAESSTESVTIQPALQGEEQTAPATGSSAGYAGSTDPRVEEFRKLVGQPVTVTADEGPARSGLLQSVESDHITLSVPMGAGNMEYFYDLNSIRSIEASR
ncbi:hypothetical protein MWU49_01045 [Alcanivorax sp. S6407]|uniref:hypothetical protein n=1 Tax=Alcanivorax sp. S6407 TaxID=2926424 RepID=UPI001FF3213B|nr:hypothetical protein [Alcanivorax sp. S6407]MCK0152276.1 hypothetical protein [Alcanivorax sp. S6407]